MMSNCTGIILAGGWSKRFGCEKATAVWNGHRFIDLISALLRSACQEVFAVIRPEQQAIDWPVDRLVRDDTQLPEGPLRGMYSGIAETSQPCFIVGCDTPLLQPRLLKLLLSEMRNEDEAVVPVWEGRPQPLHALYRPECARIFHQQLLAGEASPSRVLKQLICRFVSEDIVLRADPGGLSFVNVNFQKDLERLANGSALIGQPRGQSLGPEF